MAITRRPLLLGALGSAASTALTHSAFAQSATSGFDGEWNGALQVGAQTLRLHLSISGATATMFSVDQNNARIPATITVDHDQIGLIFPSVGASFAGRLVNGRIEGQFTQGQTFPLAFDRGEAPAAPPPAPPPRSPVPLTADVLSGLRVQSGAPAIAAMATKLNGRTLALADGLRSADARTPVTTRDQWHLGSITKSMTATLIARCVEAGVVSWDDSVGGVLVASIPDMRAEYRDVTFKHLMSHRAGLQANIPIEQFANFHRELPDARVERLAWSRLALLQEPAGPKETTFLYSNSGPVIAGAMLEAKLGATWEDIIRTRLFAPLGLSSAGFGAAGRAGALDQPVGHAQGAAGPHTPYPPGGAISDNPAALGPAGRVHMNFPDLLKYLSAHRDKRADFLRAESWDTLHTPPFGGDYALGWMRRGDTLWHNGSNTLFYAEVIVDFSRGIVAAAAANDGNLAAVTPCVARALECAGMAVA